DFGAVLEAVAGAPAEQQHVCPVGMQVDQEITVRAILVLADFGPCEGHPLQQRKSAVTVGDNLRKCGFSWFATLRVRVDFDPVGVMCELDATRLQIGEAVEDVASIEVGPARHCFRQKSPVTGRRSEVKYL